MPIKSFVKLNAFLLFIYLFYIRKQACPVDPIDPSDHLTFATYIVAEPPARMSF
jgi:hypothetical protein